MNKFQEWVQNSQTIMPKDTLAPRQIPVKNISTNAISLQDIEDSIINGGCSITEEVQENIKATTDSLTAQRYINGRAVVINQSLKDANIKGTKVYESDIVKGITRSLLTEDAEFLLDYYAGTGCKINDYTELVDFEDTIGQYYDTSTKTFEDTSMGVIIYGVNGAHIVPVKAESKSGENENKKTKTTEPSLKKDGKPKGNYQKETSRGIKRQNETADTFAKEGYDTEMLDEVAGGNGHGIEKDTNPDFLIEEEPFDCYSPDKNTSFNNVCKEIAKKLRKQAYRIVLNLDDYNPEMTEELISTIVRKAKPNGDLKRLIELFIVKDGKIKRVFLR
ncbi:toxin 50 [Clostridium cavendishii DSM 21758]|uniref:Toxin 50 n=1 Tax=Clostridium cavendishii DSM 21758 TaxID=1121302 RepID=A0A1M6ETS8_9CLOT|nr:polymorphic toxin type 50 domain-containing protein [Clostridium cavendishii]SHI88924.1 toxin 50 [Clostridium cavendishii DSM 21758]